MLRRARDSIVPKVLFSHQNPDSVHEAALLVMSPASPDLDLCSLPVAHSIICFASL